MNATEQHVGIAAQMYECRATARRLLGERFKPKMREFGKIVQAVAKRDNCNEIVAGATVIKEAKLFGMDSLTLMLKNGDYIFSPDGKNRWRNDLQIRSRWTIALKLAKVRYRNPYQTRHTFASTLLMNGEPELLVAKLLGHTTVEMIRRHYGKYIRQPNGIQLKSDYSDLGGLPRAGQLKSANGS